MKTNYHLKFVSYTFVTALITNVVLAVGCTSNSSHETPQYITLGDDYDEVAEEEVEDNTVWYNGDWWDKDELTDAFLEQMEETFPFEFGEMMYFTGVTIEADYLVYDVYVDEDIISISDLKDSKAEAKKNIIKMIQGEEIVPFLQAVGKGLAYKYIGAESEKTCTIRLTPSEVNEL